ncbi:myosin C, putative [Plasmodium ovale]|uniref:Myosin C, putative n=1 Tax=Plasmodium ovale TaxID=36330 RepID=A0A1D3TKK9_PLAOA|nr:myosin C, putative [Plasmodium ovale]
MDTSKKCVIGTKIFVRDKKKVWASAEIIKEDEDIVAKTDDDEIVRLKKGDEFHLRNSDLFDSSGLSAPADLTKLTHLHEASVLHSLNLRFDIDEIYTFTGPILIAVNPFKNIKNLYEDHTLEKHVQPIKSKSPHIFATSNSAYLGMCKNNKSQTILISGESGAGKTESTKYVMKFLSCAGSDIKKRSLIESQVLESNPLLEAFGNARTLRNDNSSRFGKYIELQFCIDKKGYVKGKLCGAKIRTYLLEKVRVCDQQEGERNYHIFYQLCRAAEITEGGNVINTINGIDDPDTERFYEFPSTSKFREREDIQPLKINLTHFRSHMHFRYLTKSSVYELNDVDELEQFECTLYAMHVIGIGQLEQNKIFRVLEGILYLGNILFNNDENKEESSILESSYDDLEKAASFLDVDVKKLSDSLCYKTIVANKEYYKKPVNANIANDIRDALARAIYGCLFLKIVQRTNESIAFANDVSLFCGVLDIFGFESFPINSFEQLCINYTNECLQQFFNSFIFKCEEKLYMEEGIKWNPEDFPDNKDCVDTLESKPYGIFCMLDEECHIPSGKDKTFCSKVISKHSGNKRFDVVKTDSSSFIISHFAGRVVYSSLGFLEKNKDQLSVDAQNILIESKDDYISSLFKKYLSRTTEKKKFTTVSSEFKEQLNLLMDRIRDTEPHFIRCIKPNAQNLPDIFDRPSVNEQLKYGGVLQAIKVSRAGYPVRLSHADCVNDYKILLDAEEKQLFESYKDKSWSHKVTFVLSMLHKREPIQAYINSMQLLHGESGEEISDINSTCGIALAWSVGKSLCFFKSDAFNILSTMRSDFRSAQAVVIQKNFKCYAQRKKYKIMRCKVILLQRWFRHLLITIREEKMKIQKATDRICMCIYGYIVRKKYVHKRNCAILIQAHVRRYLTVKFFKSYRENQYACKIQAAWKGRKERMKYRQMKEAARKIKLKWKGILARRQLRRLKEEAKEVGSLLSKNHLLTKELQKERSEKMEVESKLLKAATNIRKLTKRVDTLEKINRQSENIIKELQVKAEGAVNGEAVKGGADSKGEVTKLLERIKQLELQNEEQLRKNNLLSERYSKLLEMLSHLADRGSTVHGDFQQGSFQQGSFQHDSFQHSAHTRKLLNKSLVSPSGRRGEIGIHPYPKFELCIGELSNLQKRRDTGIDILICGPKHVGKTSLLEDLFVRLGDEINLNTLRKNKKKESEGSNDGWYNTYIINHKDVQIKIIDCAYCPNTNEEDESFFNFLKNSLCIIVVFDSTNGDSINPALHLLQEASLMNVKKDTKLYLIENIFNEKINMNPNRSDVSQAIRISKTCNAHYVKTLDIYDIINEYAGEMSYQHSYSLARFTMEKGDPPPGERTRLNGRHERGACDGGTGERIALLRSYRGDHLSAIAPSVSSMVNTLKAFCGINNTKRNPTFQLLRESMPLNNYVYSNKKYNAELGKGLQPIYEMTLKENVPITYLCMGPNNNANRSYTLLAVGCKDGAIYIYKCFRTPIEERDMRVDEEGGDTSLGDDLPCDSPPHGNSPLGDAPAKALSKLSGHKKAITCLVFDFSEDKIISSSIDKTIKIWEVCTGFLLKVFSDSSASLSVLLFPTNFDIFLCSNCTSLLRVVNLNSGHLYQKIKVESDIRSLEIDTTCLSIFAGSKTGTIYLLEFMYDKRIEIKYRFLFSASPITCIKFVPRQSAKEVPYIIVNSCDNHIGIIECTYGAKGVISHLSVKHRLRINHALLPIRSCFSRFGGGWIISGSEDGNIYVCSMLPQSNYKLIFLKHHKAPVMAVVVNDTDTLMVSGDSNGNMVFWRRSFV